MGVDPRITRFRTRLLRWGKQHIRHYPWRYAADPYGVLVAEFMLHRTQARQVLPVYEIFIARYPTLTAFARGRRATVVTILRPLGLNWRIQGMIDALKTLWRTYGVVPLTSESLLQVAGIGPYIAGAVEVFTRNAPLPLIDTNTVRVVGRVFGLDLRGEARRKRPIISAITAVCDPQHPRDFYYALIDLSHSVCLPRLPLCAFCPLLSVPCAFGVALEMKQTDISVDS